MSSRRAKGKQRGLFGFDETKEMSSQQTLYRIPPLFYIHVLDQNANITRVEIGPQTFIRQDHEQVLVGPERMINIPERHYCIVDNPVQRDEDMKVIIDDRSGQAKLRVGGEEVRLCEAPFDEPFPLYPGEIARDVKHLESVEANTALILKAIDKFDDYVSGDQWLFEGPGYYIPHVSVIRIKKIQAVIIKQNEALRLKAVLDTEDRFGEKRVAGEEWLVTKPGAYLPGVYEEVIGVLQAKILTEKKALHLRALRSFKDIYGKSRKTGQEWLVTNELHDSHIPSVYEEVVGEVEITTLSARQYCVILDPLGENGRNQLGAKKVIRGEKSFFLQPGESLENGIQDVYVLGEEDGLVIRAIEAFTDYLDGDDQKEQVLRKPGDLWLVTGPCEFVPSVKMEVLKERRAIPLDKNEGVYVRDTKTGKVRQVCGETYMLNENEELWEKDLPAVVEQLIDQSRDARADRTSWARDHIDEHKMSRDKTRVVNYRVPHNAVVQIYDYQEKKARVVFGPELVMLGPDEQFTQIRLSGGTPKESNRIKSLCLLLGPDFCTDIIEVETADHTKLSIKLSYNWQFMLDREDPIQASKLFDVADFIGDLAKSCAAKIRGAVAGVRFDEFHKHSAQIVKTAVFGTEDEEHDPVKFEANNLEVTSIDVQSVKPVDEQTERELQKSVTNAIKITTDSQEAQAKQEAERKEQRAMGELERQKLTDMVAAEKETKRLAELQAETEAVKSTGKSKAEARGRAEAARIEAEADLNNAKLRADAAEIEATASLNVQKQKQEQELSFLKAQNEMKVSLAQQMAEIESKQFVDVVNALGADTIKSIACAEQDLKEKLIQGLGIKSTLITDGNSPINLFNTAQGLIGVGGPQRQIAGGGGGGDEEKDDFRARY